MSEIGEPPVVTAPTPWIEGVVDWQRRCELAEGEVDRLRALVTSLHDAETEARLWMERAEFAEFRVRGLREGLRTLADRWDARYLGAVEERLTGPKRVIAATLAMTAYQVRDLLRLAAEPTHTQEPISTDCCTDPEVGLDYDEDGDEIAVCFSCNTEWVQE